MGDPRADKLREDALKRIEGIPSQVVLDGDPIEELARAHERHAVRLQKIIASLDSVGRRNYLGDTVEGVAATHNIKVAVHDHEGSVVKTLVRQAAEARAIAAQLRATNRSLRATEAANEDDVTKAGGGR